MDLVVLIVQALAGLLPQLVQIWSDFKADKLDADQARAAAESAFSAMWARLIDPQKDGAATNAEVDEATRKKFEGA